jgi:hypothetical protein
MSDNTPPIKRMLSSGENIDSKKKTKKVSFQDTCKKFDGMRKESLQICNTIKSFILYKNRETDMNKGEILNAKKYATSIKGDIWKYIDKVYFIISVLNSGKKYGFLPSQEAINPNNNSHNIYKKRLYLFLVYLAFEALDRNVEMTNSFLDGIELSNFKTILQDIVNN